MAKRFSFEVRMVRPDRVRPVIGRIHLDNEPNVVSERQLAGYLTHLLFTDAQRGGANTHYTVTKRDNFTNNLDVFTVERTEGGEYVHA